MVNAGLTYREAAVAGATPVRLVILLYEQAMEDLRRAVSAQLQGDIEGRTRQINHALLVIGYLESSLDKDRGGKVAINLERFYSQARAGLMEAQYKQSPVLLQQQIEGFLQVHDAWCAVEKAMQPASTENPQTASPARSDWKA